MARPSLDFVESMLADLGEEPVLGDLPNKMAVGPFSYAIDLGTALAANTVVAQLNLAATVIDPQLGQIGAEVAAQNYFQVVTGAVLVLGGPLADALDPGDLAAIQGSLYLRHVAGEVTRYRPIGLGVGLGRVATQRTQTNAADGSFGATARPQRVPVVPALAVDAQNDTLDLFSASAVGTFAGSADLDQSVLYLYGAAWGQNSGPQLTGASCGRKLDPMRLRRTLGRPVGSIRMR